MLKKSVTGKKWLYLSESQNPDIIEILLKNRGLHTKKQKEEFLHPSNPYNLALSQYEASAIQMKKAIKRIKLAVEKKEKVVVYGDYDADGICATALLWETLYKLGADVMPHIPDRFTEGYGINPDSIELLLKRYKNLGLIICVDNGISAFKAIAFAKKKGIDVIVADHHQIPKKLPKAYAIVHTTMVCGSAVSWLVSRELGVMQGLELVAIGTISDQIPLLGVNRALVKWGLKELNKTKRIGLLALFNEARLKSGEITPYTVGYIIAPRINAMGRLAHGLESLRLLCTKNVKRATEIAHTVGKTNKERQTIVEQVLVHARKNSSLVNSEGIIVVISEGYHEGVIGLAASRLVEEYFRPAIVISKGAAISKASARSIPGVNIFRVISELGDILDSGGGHEMAAGFSLKSDLLDTFIDRIEVLSKSYLTKDLLTRSLKVDTKLQFKQINKSLFNNLTQFEPTGMGNYTPTFASENVEIIEARIVGSDKRHLKLKLRQEDKIFNTIGFGMGEFYPLISKQKPVNVVYSIEEDNYNGRSDLQLKLKDFTL